MNSEVLLELAARWERDANPPTCGSALDGSPEGLRREAKAEGNREGKRECADGLRMLVKLIGE